MQTLKSFFIFIPILFCLSPEMNAQEIILKYYDSSFIPTTQDSAFYVMQNTKVENMYLKKMYWVASQKLYSVFTGPDLLLYGKKKGTAIYYHENGLVKDSSFYDLEGQAKVKYGYHDNGQLADVVYYGSKWSVDSARHYYKDGRIKARYVNAKKKKDEFIQGFDEKGVEIKDYVYGEEADFSGGMNGWRKFLQEYLNPNVPVDKGAPAGTYQIIARFIVEKDGSLSGIMMETRHGYGMEQEVLRILELSPKWKPAIHLNKVVKAYRRQPVTFVISESRR